MSVATNEACVCFDALLHELCPVGKRERCRKISIRAVFFE
jgi:hypothetical protein